MLAADSDGVCVVPCVIFLSERTDLECVSFRVYGRASDVWQIISVVSFEVFNWVTVF